MRGLQSGQRHELTGPSVCFGKQDEVMVLKIAQGLAQSSLPHPLGTVTQDFGILAWVFGFPRWAHIWVVRAHSPPSRPALLRMIPFREGLFSHFTSCRFPALVSATVSLCAGRMCRSVLSRIEVTLKETSLAWHRAKCFRSVLGA